MNCILPSKLLFAFHYLFLDQAEEYEYLTSECHIPGVDDQKCFQETVLALVTLGFSEADRMDIFYILAGILFLGNIKISDAGRGSHGDNDGSYIRVC